MMKQNNLIINEMIKINDLIIKERNWWINEYFQSRFKLQKKIKWTFFDKNKTHILHALFMCGFLHQDLDVIALNLDRKLCKGNGILKIFH